MSGKAARRAKKTTKQAFLASITNCPICDVPLDPDNATLEHVPPRKLGNKARPACVTCQECNNRFGRQYEAPMDRAARNRHLMTFRDVVGQCVMSGELEVEKGDSENFSLIWHDTWVRSGYLPFKHTVRASIENAGGDNPKVIKGWIKSMFLLVWCATNGSAAESWWAPLVKQYLLADSSRSCLGVNLSNCRHDTGDGAVLRVHHAHPAYVAVWGERACAFGLTEDMEDGDGWTLEISHHKPGPIVYGRGKWMPSGEPVE